MSHPAHRNSHYLRHVPYRLATDAAALRSLVSSSSDAGGQGPLLRVADACELVRATFAGHAAPARRGGAIVAALRAAIAAAFGLSLFAAPLAAGAPEPAKVHRIGLLDSSSPDQARLAWWQGFLRRMDELGHVEGRTVDFERRWAGGDIKRLPALAAELVRLNVDIIVTAGTPAVVAARTETTTIPIVMAPGGSPVELGFVTSLARPGANITGVTSLTAEVTAKRLDLLRELLPNRPHMAVLWDPNSGVARLTVPEVLSTAGRMGLKVRAYGVRTPDEFDHAFSAMAKDHAAGVDVATSPMFFAERGRIADLALTRRLPTMAGAREYAEAGALASYGTDYVDLFRHVATYVDRILKGAKPADLPIEQPTKFQFVINLKTAKALGLTIPQSLLLRADQAIQ